jgi:antitoxin (DNA-binding transcriptional repressor) of toxin-antitoxin stability system
MKASFLDLRRKMSSIIKALNRNESVTLAHRGHKKATIVPAKGKTVLDIQEHSAFGIWSDREDLADVDAHVRKLRKGRISGKQPAVIHRQHQALQTHPRTGNKTLSPAIEHLTLKDTWAQTVPQTWP